jgi:hypothetical protein
VHAGSSEGGLAPDVRHPTEWASIKGLIPRPSSRFDWKAPPILWAAAQRKERWPSRELCPLFAITEQDFDRAIEEARRRLNPTTRA